MRNTGFCIALLLLAFVSSVCPCPTCNLKANILKSARQTAVCAYLLKTLVPSMVIPDILVPLVRLCPVLEGFAIVKTPCDGISLPNPQINVLKPIESLAPVNMFSPIVKPPFEVINRISKPSLEAINLINPAVKSIDPINMANPIFKPPIEGLGLPKPIDPFLFNLPVKPSLDPLSVLKPIDPFLLNSLLKPTFNIVQPPNPALTVLSKTSVDAVVPAPSLSPPAAQPYTAPTPPTDPPISTPKQETPPNGQFFPPPPPPPPPPPHQFSPPQHYSSNVNPPQGFSMSSNSLLLQNYK